MAWDLLIRGGEVVTPDGVRRLDVAVENGTIVELAPDLSGPARETIDAAGLHVFPGLIDPHVHFNEPGRTEWEGFETGSSALAAGGGTCFFDMPLNSSPPTLDGESFDLKRQAAEANSRTDFALWGGLTPENLDRLEELAERGVVGFKAFMSNSGIEDFTRADDLTLYRGMTIAAKLGLPVAVHAESEEITSRLTAEIRGRGGRSWADYAASRPIVAEVEAVQRAITLAQETGCSLHVVHVSSARAVQRIRLAYERDVDVTCETCPHYLTLEEGHLLAKGAVAKCAPPLRPREEREKLCAELLRGHITFLASDHSPAPPSMKTSVDAFEVWGGIAGVQHTRSAVPHMPPEKLALLTATNVANRFRIPNKGRVDVGYDADLSLVLEGRLFEVNSDALLDRHRLSPYVGMLMGGFVRRTIVRGHTVRYSASIVGDFRGRLVTPAREGAGRA